MATSNPIKKASTPDEAQRQREALRDADASLRLEGLSASEEATAILERWFRGEIDDNELVRATQALHQS